MQAVEGKYFKGELDGTSRNRILCLYVLRGFDNDREELFRKKKGIDVRGIEWVMVSLLSGMILVGMVTLIYRKVTLCITRLEDMNVELQTIRHRIYQLEMKVDVCYSRLLQQEPPPNLNATLPEFLEQGRDLPNFRDYLMESLQGYQESSETGRQMPYGTTSIYDPYLID